MRYMTIKVHFKLVCELFIIRSVCTNNEKLLLGSSCPNRLSVCLSVSQSACLREAPTGRIFLKFDLRDIYEKSVKNIFG